MRQRPPAIESFENSLRLSLNRAIGLITETKARLQIFECSACVEPLFSEGIETPDVLDLLMDIEFSPGEWTRLHFQLDLFDERFDDFGDEVAIYKAQCDY